MPNPPDPRLFGLHVGVVVDVADPRGLGRVKVRVPGLLEPHSAWAWPLGMPGGGAANRGLFFVPPVGAEVGVFLNQGSVDHPYYIAGNYGAPGGASEVPSPAKEAGARSPEVKVLETDLWRVTLDDRTEKRNLLVENKVTGDKVEFDGLTAGILVDAKAALVLKALGVINIEGGQVVINGRVVRPGTDPI